MKNLKQYLPLAAIAAGVFALRKSHAVSGVGAVREREVIGRMIFLKYKSHSVYGNPKYIVHLETEDGDLLFGETVNNGSIGYSIKNYGTPGFYDEVTNGIMARWTYHVTGSGNVIFDYVRPL